MPSVAVLTESADRIPEDILAGLNTKIIRGAPFKHM
jgi:hypothetical protein